MATKYRRRGQPAAPPPRLNLPGAGTLQRVTDRESGPRRFYRDTRSELRKVVWPTREQAINLTVIVCIASAVVGAVLGGVDLLFGELFRRLAGGV